MTKVFVDTSAWIELMTEDAPHHLKAKNYLKGLIKEGGKLFTSNYVVDETLTRLLYDYGIRAARKFYREVKISEYENSLVVFWVDQIISQNAWEAFVKFAEHKLSFTDAASYTLMKRYRLDEIFAFDEDFKKIGLNIKP